MNAHPTSCQIPSLCGGTRPLGPGDRLRRILLRATSAIRRRVDRLEMRIHRDAWPRAAEVTPGGAQPAGPLRSGDWVEVLRRDEIARTLDGNRQCGGLEFLEGMARYCGKRLRVRREVRMLYDECQRRMLRVRRPRYILDSAVCDGQGMYDKEGCDRSCFYFWDGRWLKRSDPPNQS
jgi:hypothetical protein